MRDPSPQRRRQAARQRDRRYRKRQAAGVMTVTIEVDAAGIDFLLRTRWLGEAESADRRKVGEKPPRRPPIDFLSRDPPEPPARTKNAPFGLPSGQFRPSVASHTPMLAREAECVPSPMDVTRPTAANAPKTDDQPNYANGMDRPCSTLGGDAIHFLARTSLLQNL